MAWVRSQRMSEREREARGLVIVGEWGGPPADGAGDVVCMPANYEAVRRAYDAIREGDSGPDTLDGVVAAGGIHVIYADTGR